MYHYRETPPDGQGMTIELSARDREDAVRLLSLLLGEDVRTRTSKKFDSLQIVKAILQDRKKRATIFSRSMFGEPGWELLLALYAADTVGPRLTIGKLAQLAELPTTTALRWLSYLEDQRLIVREEHPTDARTAFVELTDKARECFKVYLSETLTPRL